MQTNIFNRIAMTLMVTGGLFLFSCEKEVLNEGITADNAQKSAQIDAASDEVDGIIEESYMLEEGIVGRSSEQATTSLPPCMTRTVVMSGLTRTVTLDFGTGCDMPNGNHLSGIITIVYVHDPAAMSRTITFTYDGFTFNNIAFSGGGSVVRILSNTNGNPQSTATVDVTATFPNNATAHRTGTKVREWIEGFGTPAWTDNAFSITGNWSTAFANGDVNSGLVTTALRREATCPFFVSGVLELSHNDNTGSLDFGDGTCNNVALFTGPNGVTYTIQLGN
jgi:hypothetical protein